MREASMAEISIDRKGLSAFCKAHGIRQLAIFGSVIHHDLTQESDVDVLVEFQPGSTPGLFGIIRLEQELSPFLDGRRVDLRTAEDLSPYFREEVIKEAEVQYAEG
jgi:predicted nucleotidyltransferase